MKGVLDPNSRVVLAVAEVLRQDDVAAQRASRFEDRGIPVRDAEALAGCRGGQHQVGRDVLDRKPQEGLHQPCGLLMGERVGRPCPAPWGRARWRRAGCWCQRTARSWSWSRLRRSRARKRLIWVWICFCWASSRENSASRPDSEPRYSATSELTEVPRSAARIRALR